MLKVLALATLATVPLALPAPLQHPSQVGQDGLLARQVALDQAVERLERFDDLAQRRKELRRDQFMIAAHLRRAKRELEDTRSSTDRTVRDLELRLDQARAALDMAEVPDANYGPKHPRKQHFDKLTEDWKALNERTVKARATRNHALNETEDIVAELEWELKSVDEKISQGEERARLEGEVRRIEAELRLAAESQPTAIRRVAPVLVQDDFRAARVAAAVAGSPLFVNFTAHTCVNGRAMEVNTFTKEGVASELKGFVEARLHTDAQDDALRADIAQRAQVLAGTSALPVYVVLDPRSGKVLGRLEGATQDPSTFAEFLASAKVAMGGPQADATNEDLWSRIFDLEEEVARLGAHLKKVSGSNW